MSVLHRPEKPRPYRRALVVSGAIAVAVAGLPSATASEDFRGGPPAKQIDITTLSTRADTVTGGDVLVAVDVPRNVPQHQVTVRVDGRDVSAAFAPEAGNPRTLVGLVNGLELGKNTVQVHANGKGRGRPAEALTIINHAIGGPVFSGPQVQPWFCATEENGLGPALDDQCNAPRQVSYFYLPAAGGSIRPYTQGTPSAEVAQTTTDEGKTVPFIVRRERGTVNRHVYDIAVLAEPGSEVAPAQAPVAWNRKLYYVYSGGALPQHKQGRPPNVFHQLALSRGFAVATSSGNVLGNNINPVTSAETTMMVKERVIESFGRVRYTLAEGGSGGAMQQHVIANAYPGLLDGIQPARSYQDIWTVNNEVQDCSLLLRYFQKNEGVWENEAERNAVLGNANQDPGTCVSWSTPDNYELDNAWMEPSSNSCLVDSSVGLGPDQPWIYDPETNPQGTRCTIQDYQVAIFGKRPDGFANRPYDNTGITYGLAALKADVITSEQFVHLNEHVGGRDIDWNWTATRSEADPFALGAVYRSSQVNQGTGMASIPIIDHRACRNNEIHSCFHSRVMRARLVQTNGHADNHVVLVAANSDGPGRDAATLESFDLLDKWVAAVKADTSDASDEEKVRLHRPADATDACWINGKRTTDAEACAVAHPTFGDPRLAAGAPLTLDVMKCQTEPLDRASYGVAFTDGQWARLTAVFPSGVCNWDLPSAGFQQPVPWLTYDGGAGGRALGHPPASEPVLR